MAQSCLFSCDLGPPRRKEKPTDSVEKTPGVVHGGSQVRSNAHDFVRDARGKKTAKFADMESSSFLMSGGLPDASTKTLPTQSFIFNSPELSGSDGVSESTRRPSAISRYSFDSNFRAEDFLQPTGFEALSHIFSQQAIRGLERCVSPLSSEFEPAPHALSRHKFSETICRPCSRSRGMQGVAQRSNSDDHFAAAATKSSELPTELIQTVFEYLGPKDFDAARHTCRTWMIASLKLQILVEQLKRGGWWSAASSKLQLFQEWRGAWPMSCYLSRECALGGDWGGQGLDSAYGRGYGNPMIETCTMDFGMLGEFNDVPPDDPPEPEKKVCGTSVCGKYFLTTAGSTIYTYEIEGQSMRLLSKTSCERKVLAVSIDASSERFALAALLEGRIGVYIDLLGGSRQSPLSSP